MVRRGSTVRVRRGLCKSLANDGFFCRSNLHEFQFAVGVEPFMELSDLEAAQAVAPPEIELSARGAPLRGQCAFEDSVSSAVFHDVQVTLVRRRAECPRPAARAGRGRSPQAACSVDGDLAGKHVLDGQIEQERREQDEMERSHPRPAFRDLDVESGGQLAVRTGLEYAGAVEAR
jgi:hypothetical protein